MQLEIACKGGLLNNIEPTCSVISQADSGFLTISKNDAEFFDLNSPYSVKYNKLLVFILLKYFPDSLLNGETYGSNPDHTTSN